MSNPRVFGINSGYDGCCYVRLYLPFSHNGWGMDKMSRNSDRISVKDIRKELEMADVVVFHRAEEETYHTLARMLKADGKKIVMDNDDTFQINDFHPLAQLGADGKSQNLERRKKNIDSFMEMCDLVTCSTETLKKEYLKHNKNVVVLPNLVDQDDWEEPLRNETDKVRIGIVGSTTIEYDYAHIKDVLRELSEREDVELVMFGLGDLKHRLENPNVSDIMKVEYGFWDSLNIEHFPWVKNYLYQETLNEAKLDLMLIPRKDNYFNRCKSNVKFLEASMLEIPVIAQSFSDGPYEEIKEGVTGFLIKDNKEWRDKIEVLIKNKELRRKVGKNAYDYVVKTHNINNHYHKWNDAYSNICEVE